MQNMSLSAYSFYLNKLHAKSAEKAYNLNDTIEIGEKDAVKQYFSATQLFESFFANYSKSVNDIFAQKTFRCEYENHFCGEEDGFQYFYAIFHSGSYGTSSSIRNINTRELAHDLKPFEAPERPFYFFVVIPKDNDKITVQKGLFFLLNIGQHGVKSLSTRLLRDYFSIKFKIAFKDRAVAPDIFVEKMLQPANISELILIDEKSNDLADNAYQGYGREKRYLGNLYFSKNRWQELIQQMHHYVGGKNRLFEFEQKKYRTFKAKVKMGEKVRTIDLHNIENLAIIEDVPQDVILPDGYPDEDKLKSHFIEVTKDYLKRMVLEF